MIFFPPLYQRVKWHYILNRWRWDIRPLFQDIDSVYIDSPIFLLGTQGGGLTLVSRILRRSPEVVTIHADSRYWKGPDEMQLHFGEKLPEELRLRHSSIRKKMGVSETFEYATNENLKYFRKTADDVTPEVKRRFERLLREIINRNSCNAVKARFLDKSQSFTIKVSFLAQLLEQWKPYFVLITRNPFAICLREARKYNSDKSHYSNAEEKLRAACQHWTNSFRIACNDGENLKRFRVWRFEDILVNPHCKIGEICEFTEIHFTSSMLPQPDETYPIPYLIDNKWYPIKKNINNKYIKSITEKEVGIIRETCNDLLAKFDYSERDYLE
jgi:hypothetical protein